MPNIVPSPRPPSPDRTAHRSGLHSKMDSVSVLCCWRFLLPAQPHILTLKKCAMSSKALREPSPEAPAAEVWYLPISATWRKLDVITKLHH